MTCGLTGAMTGSFVRVVASGSSIIELYQIAVLYDDQNCVQCSRDFQFIQDLPSLAIQTIKVGDPIL